MSKESKEKIAQERAEEEEELYKYEGPDKMITWEEKLKELKKQPDIELVKSKIPRLDSLIGGFEPSELIIVSGFTGHGKTSFCQTLTKSFGTQNVKSAWFSFEIGEKHFSKRLPEGIKEKTLIVPARKTPKSMDWLRKRIIEAQVKYEIKAAFIDHLHYIIDLSSSYPSMEIGAAVRDLKQIANERNLIVFLIAHTMKPKGNRALALGDIRDCLPADQLVYTSNGKRVPVEDIKKGDKVISKGSSFRLQDDKVQDKWKTGKKKIFRLRTKTGREIECSEGQKFYATTHNKADEFGPNQGVGIQGWTKLKNLEKGQKIAVVKKYPEPQTKSTISIDRATILGWVIGDGHIKPDNFSTEISVHTKQECEKLKEIIDKEFSLDCSFKKIKDKDAYRFYITGDNTRNDWSRWLKKLDYSPKGSDKYVPKVIFQQSNDVVAGFLRGLFQADGNVYLNKPSPDNEYPVVRFDNISQSLVKSVQHLLLRFGIIGRFKTQKMEASGFRTENENIYQVSITGPWLKRFRDKIGFFLSKNQKLNEITKDWKPKWKLRKSDLYFDKVKDIKFVGEKETWDFEVEGKHKSLPNHTYCVNDFLTHNSSFITQESDAVLGIRRQIKRDGKFSNESELKVLKHRRTGVMDRIVKLNYIKNEFFELEEKFPDPL